MSCYTDIYFEELREKTKQKTSVNTPHLRDEI
jgi:hypothetical protein